MKSNEKNLGTGNIGKLFFSLAVPAVTAQIVNVLYNMVDRMYIGHIPVIGAQALTGVGVCMPLILIISAFAALAGMGGAPRASIMLGKGKQQEAEKILGNCTTLLIGLSLLLTVLILVFGKDLLLLFGASENTIGYAWDYMFLYACGTIFVQLSLGLNMFITAQGFAKTSMMTVVIGAVCNIILDPIFIFGFDMGVKGAAIATVISQAVSCIWVLKFLSGSKAAVPIRLKNLKLSAPVILPCLALGLSPFIMQATESLITVCFNSSLLRYGGDLEVGAMTIIGTVMQFSMLPLVGMSQGAQPIVSYNYGAGNGERVKKTFQILLRTSLIYSASLWLIAMVLPQIFVSIFTKDPALAEASIRAMRIYMSVSLLFGIQISCQQTFIAIGNAGVSVFLAVLRKIILLLPLIYLLPMFFENQVAAVYLAEPVADFIAVMTTGILFAVQFRKTLKKLDGNPQPAPNANDRH